VTDELDIDIYYYIGSAEGHEYPDLQVGDEVNPRPFFGCESMVKWQILSILIQLSVTLRNFSGYLKQCFNSADQRDSDNQTRQFLSSNQPGVWACARSIPHPLRWGGRTQFDFPSHSSCRRSPFASC
jgi:hypothetical protein